MNITVIHLLKKFFGFILFAETFTEMFTETRWYICYDVDIFFNKYLVNIYYIDASTKIIVFIFYKRWIYWIKFLISFSKMTFVGSVT